MPAAGPAGTYYAIPTGSNYFTLKDEDIAYSLEGAVFFSFEDILNKRNVNYRNEMPASFAGGPAAALAIAGGTGTGVELAANKEIIEGSDSFTATEPHKEEFENTMVFFWDDSGAAGAPGKVVAMCEYSKFEQFSPALPVAYG